MGRRPLAENLKKKTSEYPQLAFRLSEVDKATLLKQVEIIAKDLNRRRSDDEPFLTKGDVFVKALYIGFNQLRKK